MCSLEILYFQGEYQNRLPMTRIVLILLFCLCARLIMGQSLVSGTVSWSDGTPLDIPATVLVKLIDPGTGQTMIQLSFAVQNGEYNMSGHHFINPLMSSNVEVTVLADVNPRSQVSVLDILRVRMHITGAEPFTHALEIYAADVNASGGVSVLDMVEIRKMILGFYTKWPAKEAISFFQRTDVTPPATGANLISTVTFPWGGPNGTADIVVDFWAVKTGDVVR